MMAALVVATGKTARKNSFEPAKEVGTIPAIRRAVMVFQRAGIERIVVVCQDDKTEKLVARMNLVFLYSSANAQMLDSVKLGLEYLKDKCDAALIAPVDVPLFSVDTLHALMQANCAACVPSYQGHAGHPLLLRAEYFAPVLAYDGPDGLAGALKSCGVPRQFVEVADAGVLADIQTQDPWQSLLKTHSLSQVYPEIQIRLVKEKAFYGPGVHQLLQLTQEMGSLLEACRRLGISYSKGRGMIATLEQQLGDLVLARQQGGVSGGSSVVTERGKQLMRNYSAYCAAAKAQLQQLFHQYFEAEEEL